MKRWSEVHKGWEGVRNTLWEVYREVYTHSKITQHRREVKERRIITCRTETVCAGPFFRLIHLKWIRAANSVTSSCRADSHLNSFRQGWRFWNLLNQHMFSCFLPPLPKSTAIGPVSQWMVSLFHMDGCCKDQLQNISKVVSVQVKASYWSKPWPFYSKSQD